MVASDCKLEHRTVNAVMTMTRVEMGDSKDLGTRSWLSHHGNNVMYAESTCFEVEAETQQPNREQIGCHTEAKVPFPRRTFHCSVLELKRRTSPGDPET